MTNQNLINLACMWLNHNSSKYIVTGWKPHPYVAGGCQTDLRAFLNKCKNLPDTPEVFYDDVADENGKFKDRVISK